ncbi:MAG: mercuric reductase [Planctomycetes bacterium]|nr:mercuric reductase [Planctomycetota bacterium]
MTVVNLLPDDLHNRALLEEVHPSSWKNPKPAGRYNLVVVGAGTAGLVSALGAAGLGAKVALVERHLMGGDCLNYGCVPSKALLAAARAAHSVRVAGSFGVEIRSEVEVDFAHVMERMRRLRASIAPHDGARRLAREGVDVYLGEARFVAPGAVEVAGERLEFSRAVIATGARAAALPIPGLSEAGYLTNETVFSLTELPRRLAVIGAGPIGCELAQAFARFGSQVTLLEALPQILVKEDRDAALLVEKALVRDGVRIVTACKIGSAECRMEAERSPVGKTLRAEHDGKNVELTVDEILVGVGRVPNTDGLALEAAGVEFDKTGVKVDDRLRTTNRRIFAAGDICSPYKFTHAADAMARIALQNALFLGRKRASALVVPWCTYTDPEIAHVGLYEKEARDRGFDVATLTVELKEVDRAILDGETEGFARVHYEKPNGRILGVTIVARHAGEMIGEASLAMTAGLDLGAIARTIHPYPTQAEALKRLGDQYMRTRLTPWVRGILDRYFGWWR